LAARFDKVLHSEERRTSYKPRSAFTRARNSGLSSPSPRPINNNNGSQGTQKPKFTKFTNELRQQVAKEGSSSSSFSLLRAAYLEVAGNNRNTTRNCQVDEMDKKEVIAIK